MRTAHISESGCHREFNVVSNVNLSAVDIDQLRDNVKSKYSDVATNPEEGFHFHTGRPLAAMLAYTADDLDGLPESAIESFAGTGNPFSQGWLKAGEAVVYVGSGAGFDSLQAARQVGPSGPVIGVDMTQAMLDKATEGASEMGLTNAEFRLGYAESLPVDDGFADVVISNGVINLTPDKMRPVKEIFRVLKPGGRIQIGDIVVHVEVPQSAKDDIDLWSG
jgi:arsenite methyltransferase